MPLCTYASDAGIFSSTPVANLFIQEYMLQAPGDYVKVYLYGLMQSVYPSTAEATIRKFAASLGLDIPTVQKAFSYWVTKGLLRENTTQQGYEYLDVRNVLFDGVQSLSERRLIDFSELANRIAAVAPEYHFSAFELEHLYDLCDIDGFEEDAIIAMLQHGITIYHGRLNNTRLQALIALWQEKQLKTLAQSKEYILGVSLSNSPANSILLQLGIMHRNVSVAEHQLYQKWIALGFSHEAIMVAADTPSVRNPNFQYIDKKLSTLQKNGLLSKDSIQQDQQTSQEDSLVLQECKHRLGLIGAITPEHRRLYSTWKEIVSDDILFMICDDATRNNSATFEYVDFMVHYYQKNNITTIQEVENDRIVTHDLQTLLTHLGIRQQPTATGKQDLARWMQSMPFEVILQGAEYARHADKPMGYLTRILHEWQAKGICTVAQARAEREKHQQANRSTASSTKALSFDSAPIYTSQELEHLIHSIPATGDIQP